jgi:hypothetical protein
MPIPGPLWLQPGDREIPTWVIPEVHPKIFKMNIYASVFSSHSDCATGIVITVSVVEVALFCLPFVCIRLFCSFLFLSYFIIGLELLSKQLNK